MGDEWTQNLPPQPDPNQPQPDPNQFNRDDIERRIDDIRRTVVQGANEAQQRIKRVVDRAGGYWQQAQTPVTPRQSTSDEEQRIRQLANAWSAENWRVARELGTYMELVSWSTDEIWEVTLQTRWETRAMEMMTEPYTGRAVGKTQPLLPVWDYDLPEITGLKAAPSRIHLPGLDEIVACSVCNGTGRALCTACTGRGWIVCPDCKGRTKKRCPTCRGRGYVADWVDTQKKPFFKRQAENLGSSVNERVSDVFEGIRQQGVPIPNPIDTDPATKGKTVPCPDCVNGEVDCTCGNGKRVCEVCQGAKSVLCASCGGTGKVVRSREIARRFDLSAQTQLVGNAPIPERKLAMASGEMVYSAETQEELYQDAAPNHVPMDVWRVAVDMAEKERASHARSETPQNSTRATLQVLELVRVPYTKVDYRYGEQDYTFYVYDAVGQEKFYADRHPQRWDRIERLVRAITTDLMAPAQPDTPLNGNPPGGYRVHIEVPPTDPFGEEE